MATRGFYEFFAGGGMARAGIGERWSCLFANDFDPKKSAVYGANWGDDALHVGDVAQVDVRQLPGRADLVWASFPCQDLSLAGAGAGLDGARSGTFWPFWSLMEKLADEGRKPRAIVLENVCGLLTSREGADFKSVIEAVAKGGYWVGALVMDAAHFLPQSRPRLFIVAIDLAQPIAGRTQQSDAVGHWHSNSLQRAQSQLSDATRGQWMWFAPPPPAKMNIRLVDIVEDEPQEVGWHSKQETARLLDMMTPVNRAKVTLAATNGGRVVGAIYKRTRHESGQRIQRAEVRFDMAGCLRTPGGGSSRQTLIIIQDGYIRTRLITPRETARLMGLPDEYVLPARYNDAYHVTGDGVAVPVVRHIMHHIIEPCLEITSHSYVAA